MVNSEQIQFLFYIVNWPTLVFDQDNRICSNKDFLDEIIVGYIIAARIGPGGLRVVDPYYQKKQSDYNNYFFRIHN